MKYCLDSQQDLCFPMKRESTTNIEKVHALKSQDSGYIKSYSFLFRSNWLCRTVCV